MTLEQNFPEITTSLDISLLPVQENFSSGKHLYLFFFIIFVLEKSMAHAKICHQQL